MEACHRRGLARRGAPVRVAACASCRHRGHHLRPARAVLEASGSGRSGRSDPAAMYGAILLLLMPPASSASPCASKGEAAARGSGSQASGPTAARCRAAHDLVEGFFAAASVSAAVVWPSAFGLVYLLTGAVALPANSTTGGAPRAAAPTRSSCCCAQPRPAPCTLGSCSHRSAVRRPWILRSGNLWTRVAKAPWDLLRLCCGLFHGNQGIPVRRDRPGLPDRNPCGLPRVPRVLGRAKSRTRGTSLSTSLGSPLRGVGRIPAPGAPSRGAGEAEGLRRDMWDFGSESEYSEAFLSSWMYFGNVCACCLIVVTPSLLTNLLLLFALVNVFLIQHQRPQVFSMGRMGQFFCALVLMASYCGSVFACSERGVLAFVGLHCIRGVSYRSFVLAVEVGLVLLYSTFGHVARNTVRGSEEGGVFGRQPETPGILEKKSSIAAEATLVAWISWLGLLLAAHLANSLWISVHRVNVSAISSLLHCGPTLRPCRQEERPGRLAGDVPILLDALPGRPHSVRQCDAALRLPGRTKDILTNLGLISSSPLTDVFPFVSLIFLNLLLQHAKAWCGGLLDEERVQTLRVWRAGQRCLRWTSAAIQYLLTAGLLTGVFVLGQTRIAACCNDYFNFLGLGYLTITCFHFVGSWNGRASRAAWTATQWLAFGTTLCKFCPGQETLEPAPSTRGSRKFSSKVSGAWTLARAGHASCPTSAGLWPSCCC